jgi:hypothetical protein
MIRRQALESFCLVYYLTTLQICTGHIAMAVNDEVGNMRMDMTVTFKILSQHSFGGLVR